VFGQNVVRKAKRDGFHEKKQINVVHCWDISKEYWRLNKRGTGAAGHFEKKKQKERRGTTILATGRWWKQRHRPGPLQVTRGGGGMRQRGGWPHGGKHRTTRGKGRQMFCPANTRKLFPVVEKGKGRRLLTWGQTGGEADSCPKEFQHTWSRWPGCQIRNTKSDIETSQKARRRKPSRKTPTIRGGKKPQGLENRRKRRSEMAREAGEQETNKSEFE